MISDCAGAISIMNSGKNTFQFIGTGGDVNEFKNYPSLNLLRNTQKQIPFGSNTRLHLMEL